MNEQPETAVIAGTESTGEVPDPCNPNPVFGGGAGNSEPHFRPILATDLPSDRDPHSANVTTFSGRPHDVRNAGNPARHLFARLFDRFDRHVQDLQQRSDTAADLARPSGTAEALQRAQQRPAPGSAAQPFLFRVPADIAEAALRVVFPDAVQAVLGQQ